MGHDQENPGFQKTYPHQKRTEQLEGRKCVQKILRPRTRHPVHRPSLRTAKPGAKAPYFRILWGGKHIQHRKTPQVNQAMKQRQPEGEKLRRRNDPERTNPSRNPENESEQEALPSTPANSRSVWPPEATKTPGPKPTPSKPPNRRGWHRSSLPPGEEEIKSPPHEEEPAPATNPTPCEQTPTQESLSEENSTPETNERETSSSGKEDETVPTVLEKTLKPNDPADVTTEWLWEQAATRSTTHVTGGTPTASPTQSPNPEESEMGPENNQILGRDQI
ncbi:proteoglycan 4-like [Pleurodeles waltl]|uniref:proteoglycan 4-like n=1 Tax=Pleurodeles waltl TaxID=8319 RepID=UPI0037098843